MDSGSTYPVEGGLKVTITEGQRLRIYAYGHEDDEDNYGTATIEWGDDQLRGQYPVNAHYITGKGDGEFRMHYKISVKWIRPPATPPRSAIGPFGGNGEIGMIWNIAIRIPTLLAWHYVWKACKMVMIQH